jgi:hypothetical protein
MLVITKDVFRLPSAVQRILRVGPESVPPVIQNDTETTAKNAVVIPSIFQYSLSAQLVAEPMPDLNLFIVVSKMR